MSFPWPVWAQGHVRLDTTVKGDFVIEGGAALTPEFLALLIGLVVYTGTFVAEVVRVEPKPRMAYGVGVKLLHARDPIAPQKPTYA